MRNIWGTNFYAGETLQLWLVKVPIVNAELLKKGEMQLDLIPQIVPDIDGRMMKDPSQVAAPLSLNENIRSNGLCWTVGIAWQDPTHASFNQRGSFMSNLVSTIKRNNVNSLVRETDIQNALDVVKDKMPSYTNIVGHDVQNDEMGSSFQRFDAQSHYKTIEVELTPNALN